MAIEHGHEFKKEHGYTGSAEHGKDHRPKIHGYKYGGGAEEGHTFVENAKEHMGKNKHTDHDGDQHMGKASYDKHGFQHVKHGGMSKHHKG